MLRRFGQGLALIFPLTAMLVSKQPTYLFSLLNNALKVRTVIIYLPRNASVSCSCVDTFFAWNKNKQARVLVT